MLVEMNGAPDTLVHRWYIAMWLQCLWRCHAAEQNCKFRATWQIHEHDMSAGGHHSTHAIAKSLGRLARRTTVSYASRKAYPRQISRGSLMDASHGAGCTELSSHAGATGDTFDIDDPISPFPAATGGISWFYVANVTLAWWLSTGDAHSSNITCLSSSL